MVSILFLLSCADLLAQSRWQGTVGRGCLFPAGIFPKPLKLTISSASPISPKLYSLVCQANTDVSRRKREEEEEEGMWSKLTPQTFCKKYTLTPSSLKNLELDMWGGNPSQNLNKKGEKNKIGGQKNWESNIFRETKATTTEGKNTVRTKRKIAKTKDANTRKQKENCPEQPTKNIANNNKRRRDKTKTRKKENTQKTHNSETQDLEFRSAVQQQQCPENKTATEPQQQKNTIAKTNKDNRTKIRTGEEKILKSNNTHNKKEHGKTHHPMKKQVKKWKQRIGMIKIPNAEYRDTASPQVHPWSGEKERKNEQKTNKVGTQKTKQTKRQSLKQITQDKKPITKESKPNQT